MVAMDTEERGIQIVQHNLHLLVPSAVIEIQANISKLRDMLSAKGWTSYRLAKESGLSQSTIINIYKRSSVPSIDTLEAICKGFGITLSQFFTEGESVELTPELKEVFEQWAKLTPNEKELVLNMIKTLNKK